MNDLLKGIAVVIDDRIFEETQMDLIHNIVDQIDVRGIPTLRYDAIPDNYPEVVKHFSGNSFLVLDWQLQDPSLPPGSPVAKDLNLDDITDFIRVYKENIFGPIFIFTSVNTTEVQNHLKDNGLFDRTVFISNKSALAKENLFGVLDKWLRASPAIYLLKEWEREYRSAKTAMFQDFNKMDDQWPGILWKSFEKDKINSSIELGEMMTRNVFTRMSPFQFDGDLLNCSGEPTRESIRKVLQGEKFLPADSLDPETPATGDLFKHRGKVYLNVRPDCDNIQRGNGKTTDDIELYLLRATKLSAKREFEDFDQDFQNFQDNEGFMTIFCLFEQRTYRIYFKTVKIATWGEFKEDRKGRLLAPYRTRLQQKFSAFTQRVGLPSISNDALLDYTPPETPET